MPISAKKSYKLPFFLYKYTQKAKKSFTKGRKKWFWLVLKPVFQQVKCT